MGKRKNSVSQEFLDEITVLLKQGLTYRQIQNKIGYSEHFVRKYAIKLGLAYSRNTWTDEELEEATEFYKNNCHHLYLHEIAEKFGRSPEGLRKHLISLGISTERKLGVKNNKYDKLSKDGNNLILYLPEEEVEEKLEIIYKQCKINKDTGCIDWTGDSCHKGYGRIRIHSKYARVHRLIYVLYYGEELDSFLKQPIMHLCDRPCCINPFHLKKGTHSENIQSAYDKGRKVGRTKCQLPPEIVKNIRQDYIECPSLLKLANKYNKGKQVISNIVNYRTYKNV